MSFFPWLILGGGAVAGAYVLLQRSYAKDAAYYADLAARNAGLGPRGEYAFNPDKAAAIASTLTSMGYSFPNSSDATMVELSSASSTPLTTAAAWAAKMNQAQSILAPLYMAEAMKAGQDKFLRAVDPGKEAEFSGPGGMYAVLFYAGAIAQLAAPPGNPPSVTTGVPVPSSAALALAAELPPELVGPVVDLLQNGTDPAAMSQVAARLTEDAATNSAAIVAARAAQLATGQNVPSASNVPASLLLGAPLSTATPYVVTTSQPGDPGRLKVRSLPDATQGDGNVVGSLANGSPVNVKGPAVNGFLPVDLSLSKNASRAGEPGGTSDGSWPAGSAGFASAASLTRYAGEIDAPA